jgi:hypothetical protein
MSTDYQLSKLHRRLERAARTAATCYRIADSGRLTNDDATALRAHAALIATGAHSAADLVAVVIDTDADPWPPAGERPT